MRGGPDADTLLDDAVALDDFMTWSLWSLKRVGFRPINALALASLCRDELMTDTSRAIERAWGSPFQLGALGGMSFAGRTGLQAALGHVPGEDGRHRFVIFALPHIGVDLDGTLGRVQRRGMMRESSACGALVGFRNQLLAGERAFTLDERDAEQSLLRMRLCHALSNCAMSEVPDLLTLTDLVLKATVDDVHEYVDLAREREPVDVAYISGIVVHLPSGEDLVAHVEASVEIDGSVVSLPH